ncbi:MAG: hypothetical protein JWO03_2103 [Bacteroidetes bacterium]|nr:hypothetical protein [Bacteroidota bacterium]
MYAPEEATTPFGFPLARIYQTDPFGFPLHASDEESYNKDKEVQNAAKVENEADDSIENDQS